MVNRLPTSTNKHQQPKPITCAPSPGHRTPLSPVQLFGIASVCSFRPCLRADSSDFHLICVTALGKGKSVSCQDTPVPARMTFQQQDKREGEEIVHANVPWRAIWHLLYIRFFQCTIPAKRIRSDRVMYCNRSEVTAMSNLDQISRTSVRSNANITHDGVSDPDLLAWLICEVHLSRRSHPLSQPLDCSTLARQGVRSWRFVSTMGRAA